MVTGFWVATQIYFFYSGYQIDIAMTGKIPVILDKSAVE